MPPFLILAIALHTYTDNFSYGLSAIIIFWIIYYSWNYNEEETG